MRIFYQSLTDKWLSPKNFVMRVNRDFFDSEGETLSSAQTVPADRVEQTLSLLSFFCSFFLLSKSWLFFRL